MKGLGEIDYSLARGLRGWMGRGDSLLTLFSIAGRGQWVSASKNLRGQWVTASAFCYYKRLQLWGLVWRIMVGAGTRIKRLILFFEVVVQPPLCNTFWGGYVH